MSAKKSLLSVLLLVLWLAQHPAAAQQLRADQYGDPLPRGALARMGSARFTHGAMIRCLAFSPREPLLASSGSEGQIKLWQLPSGRLLRQLNCGNKGLGAIVFSADGKHLVAVNDKRVQIWHVATGRLVRTFLEHKRRVMALAVSSDGKLVASGDWDGVVCLWELGSAKLQQKLKFHGWIWSLAFSPRATRLLVAGESLTVIPLASKGKRVELPGHCASPPTANNCSPAVPQPTNSPSGMCPSALHRARSRCPLRGWHASALPGNCSSWAAMKRNRCSGARDPAGAVCRFAPEAGPEARSLRMVGSWPWQSMAERSSYARQKPCARSASSRATNRSRSRMTAGVSP